jgi:hypothetical protein
MMCLLNFRSKKVDFDDNQLLFALKTPPDSLSGGVNLGDFVASSCRFKAEDARGRFGQGAKGLRGVLWGA